MAKKYKYNDNNLAICYYRYSSHAQNDASIEQQQEAAQEYARAHGYTIIREYKDRAKSGTDAEKRDGYQDMLAEVKKLKPSVLIMWKTDRLGRDRYELAIAKHKIKSAGCRIELVAEVTPDDTAEGGLMEAVLDGMAEYYSRNLSSNVARGMYKLAKEGLYVGQKYYGYTVDDTKHYIEDPETAPVVKRIFAMYAAGERMKDIADQLNSEGRRTIRGAKFTDNSLRSILHNETYIGVYEWGGLRFENQIPPLVSKDVWDEVQKRFQTNKQLAAQRAQPEEAPRYWLTGKLVRGECGHVMNGMAGTSKQGVRYYYYRCHPKLKCKNGNVRADKIEAVVIAVLKEILHDDGNRASLAVDAANYYQEHYIDTHYLDGLRTELKDTRKSLNNIVAAIEKGIVSDTVLERLQELESRKSALQDAIEAEETREAVAEDEHTIKAYFERFAHADFDDDAVRDYVLDYFIDKIYVYDDRLVFTGWYSDDRKEVTFEDWQDYFDEVGEPPGGGAGCGFEHNASCSTTIKKPPARRLFHGGT